MRFKNFGVLAGSMFGLFLVTTGGAGGCSSTTSIVDALNDAAAPKVDGGTVIADDGGEDIVEVDSGTTTKDSGSKDTSTGDSTTITDASPDAIVIQPKFDSGPLADGGVCPGKAPTSADLDGSGGWNPPPASVTIGACSPANITQFQSNFTGAKTYNDLKNGLPAACSSCIFSLETSATWSFVVTDAAAQLGFLNYGACYARAQFGSNACGKAVQYTEFCINSSCADCPTEATNTACQSGSQAQNACSANLSGQIQAGCGSSQAQLQSLDTDCGSAVKAVDVLCGTGP